MLAVYLRSLVRSPDLADDLFQETLLTAWRRLEDYDRARPFGPWLRGIATRLVLRQRERADRDLLCCDSEVLAALEQRFAAEPAASRQFERTLERLALCLGRLPRMLSEVVRLVYEQGLRLRDVALRVQASEEATKKRLQRGRARLAECLDAEGVE